MADTTLATASQVQVWDSKYLSEYVRASRFKPYMGKAEGDGSNPLMPIMVKTELQKAGKTVNIPLLTRLQGDGVQGNERLSGSEEAISNYNFAITVNYNRNAISIPEADEHWTEMDLRGAAKMLLRTWSSEVLRDDLIIGLADIYGRSYVKGRLDPRHSLHPDHVHGGAQRRPDEHGRLGAGEPRPGSLRPGPRASRGR
jgi:hypothetical protein